MGILNVVRILIGALVLALCAPAAALEPSDAGWWHSPGNSGSGILLEYSAPINAFAVLWFDHDFEGRQQWFISGENCAVGEPCQVPMLRTSAPWLGGDITFTDVGTLTLTRVPEGLLMDWALLGLDLPDYYEGSTCGDLTPGGLIFLGCVGQRVLQQLTQPVPGSGG